MAFVVEFVAGCGRPTKAHCRNGRSARRGRYYTAAQRPSANDPLPVVEAPGKKGVGNVSERVRDFMRRAPGDPLSGLMRADEMWLKMRMRTGKEHVRTVIDETPSEDFAEIDFDVLICGGSLGIFLALALAKRGIRVAVVERGRLIGRDQEWNVSRKEMKILIEMGLLTGEDIEEAIVSEFNPVRVSFKGMDDIHISDILNCGVSPKWLLEKARTRFVEDLGGTLLEEHLFENARVGHNAVQVNLRVQSGASGSLGSGGAGTEGESSSETVALRARLLVDAMGNFSPIVQQQRAGEIPEGVCLVVGSCARADWPSNDQGDLLYSFTPIEGNLQYFWEAFPSSSKGGPSDLRTTYMFSYLDTNMERPSLAEFYDAYLNWLPEYQGKEIHEIEPIRALFAAFPTYKNSPLRTKFDRLLMFGDSSGIQSPLSFGGFGAMLRHLRRIDLAVSEALKYDALDKGSLKLLSPYMPSLSVTWLFQRAMSVPADREVADPDIINKVLRSNFSAMDRMGDSTLRPFLQDVIQFPGLTRAITGMMTDPVLVWKILNHVGLAPLLDWWVHYVALAIYDVRHRLLPDTESSSSSSTFEHNRLRESLKFGAGRDYDED
ncbi:hypothetical protein NDN08_006963 [Rhodosorus marinus]|uniref:FAD-binding domain-containing protein n=1 Tax=Rhodosorus marinus TaxID=101924 RepID=A0AAV8UPN7_9RHOD|nr:hypothetical protein NDN08_006963 [Rhodosorus marinus]